MDTTKWSTIGVVIWFLVVGVLGWMVGMVMSIKHDQTGQHQILRRVSNDMRMYEDLLKKCGG